MKLARKRNARRVILVAVAEAAEVAVVTAEAAEVAAVIVEAVAVEATAAEAAVVIVADAAAIATNPIPPAGRRELEISKAEDHDGPPPFSWKLVPCASVPDPAAISAYWLKVERKVAPMKSRFIFAMKSSLINFGQTALHS